MIIRFRPGATNVEAASDPSGRLYQVLGLEQLGNRWLVILERAGRDYPISVPLDDCEIVSGALPLAWLVARRETGLMFAPEELLDDGRFIDEVQDGVGTSSEKYRVMKERLSAPASTAFEERITNMLLAGESPFLEGLRRQLAVATALPPVLDRDARRTTFRLPADVALVGNTAAVIEWGDVVARRAGQTSDHSVWMLRVMHGRLDCVTGYVLDGTWAATDLELDFDLSYTAAPRDLSELTPK